MKPTRFALLALAAIVPAVWGCADEVTSPSQTAPEVTARRVSPPGIAASAGRYVLVAGKWTDRQTEAVEAAGGVVLFAHAPTGIGAVRSDDPDFLAQILSTSAFSYGFADERVEWVEPGPYAELDEAAVTPGDEGFFAYQWNLQSMEVPQAWESGADGSGARVAVLDGGLYDLHPDIAPNLDAGCSTSFVPGLPYNTENNTFWHGTHVAAIIAGADNGFGIIGVAPEATLMHVKVLHDFDGDGSAEGDFSWIIAGILFASDPTAFPGFGSCTKADVINMSLGAVLRKRETRGFQAALAKAVNFAASRNVLVISAAGNNGLDFGKSADYVSVPAQSGSGVAVSATGPTGFLFGATNFRRPASYSNYGEDLVFVAAPGGDFADLSAYPYDMVLSACRGTSTPPSFSFCFAAGTSMAAPAAAGVAALIVGENPGISLGRLKAMLMKSADDEGKIGKDAFYGHGFVNAYKAVN